MATLLTATVQVQHAEAGPPRLKLEFTPDINFGTGVPFRCYPPNPNQVVSKFGTFSNLGNTSRLIENETVTFDNSESAPTEYPNPTGLTITPSGIMYDSELNAISPSFVYNTSRDVIEAFVAGQKTAVIGAIHVDYTVNYTRFEYTPFSGTVNGILTTIYSNIIAYKDGAIATLDMRVQTREQRDWIEAYNVFSYVLTDDQTTPESSYEYPPGWPGDPSYQGLPSAPTPADTSITRRRVVEIGWVDRLARGFRRNYYEKIYQPYVGSATYKPAWKFEKGSVPAGFFVGLSTIDYNKIFTNVQSRYPGVVQI